MERAPTRLEIEAEFQSRREDAKRRADTNHMSSGSQGGARVDLSSPSSRVSNADEDCDLHKRMLGLEESLKLIMAALKIGGVETTQTMEDNIGRVKSLNIAKEDTGGVDHMSTAKENTGGVESTETAQEET